VEAHRLCKRPLYRRRENLLVRTTADGWLPDIVAERLRHRHLCAPGPIEMPAVACAYAYPMDEADSLWLDERLGPAVAGGSNATATLDVVLGRRLAGAGRLFRAGTSHGVLA
jgi:hypothetical protein